MPTSPNIIGVAGSRNPSQQTINAVHSFLRSLPSGAQVVTGCCKGVDQACRQQCLNLAIPSAVIHTKAQNGSSLRLRTGQVVSHASRLVVFVSHVSVPHSGSWLAVGMAIKANKPVAVYIPQSVSSSSLPHFWGVHAWQWYYQGLVKFWQPTVPQTSLFGGQPCPECNNQLISQSGCNICQSCGFSNCS